jgi:ribonuclease P protein component
MIPGLLRLPRKRIDILFKKGKKLGNDCFAVRFIASLRPGNPSNRFCVIISGTLEPSAVKRNLLRRRIYEIIRLNTGILPKGLDMVIIGKKPLIALSYARISSSLTTLFKKLGR